LTLFDKFNSSIWKDLKWRLQIVTSEGVKPFQIELVIQIVGVLSVCCFQSGKRQILQYTFSIEGLGIDVTGEIS